MTAFAISIRSPHLDLRMSYGLEAEKNSKDGGNQQVDLRYITRN